MYFIYSKLYLTPINYQLLKFKIAVINEKTGKKMNHTLPNILLLVCLVVTSLSACNSNSGSFDSSIESSIDSTVGNTTENSTSDETKALTSRLTDPAIQRPAKGESVDDNVFGTTITRIIKSDAAIASYPKVQSWNQDMTLLRIGNRIYDANTLVETPITKGDNSTEAYNMLCSRSSDYFRWSSKVANRFFVMNSSYHFIQGEISDNNVDCSNQLDAFDEYEIVHMGPYEGNIDYNDKYVVFAAKKPDDETIYVILFDIPNKKRVWTKTLDDNQWELTAKGVWSPTLLDWISVSPSGRYIVTNEKNKNSFQDGLNRYTIDFSDKQKLQYDYQGTLYSEGGHGDMGFDSDGNEVVVQFMTGLGVHSFNLENPNELGKELLKSPYGGGHVSCRNTQREGWCYITTHQEGYKQVFALKLDGTSDESVQNFAQSHIHSNYPETYGAASPDGSKVIFNSNWDNERREIDTYIAEAQ